MVRAWYMDVTDADKCLEHMTDPPKFLDLNEVNEKTGTGYWKLDPTNFASDGSLDKIRKDKNLNYEDVLVCSREKLPDYDQKLKNFYQEHMHSDEEVRFITDGSGYFDLRDVNDRWIRVEVTSGDLLVLPAGIYHRFTLDTKQYVEMIRLFSGVPVWTAHYRPADVHPARQEYVKTMGITA